MPWRGTERIPSGTHGISSFPGDTSPDEVDMPPCSHACGAILVPSKQSRAGALPLSKQLEDNNAAQRTKL